MASKMKLSKVLLGGAVMGAAIAGGIAYLLKKKDDSWNEDLEDFDDNMSEAKDTDTEDDTPVSREYVTLHTEHSHLNDAVEEEAGEGHEAFTDETDEKNTEPAEEPKAPAEDETNDAVETDGEASDEADTMKEDPDEADSEDDESKETDLSDTKEESDDANAKESEVHGFSSDEI